MSLMVKSSSFFKFADDGTLKITGVTTAESLDNLDAVCRSLHLWSSTWRMIINCNPSKTEPISFGTVEENRHLISETVKLGITH